MEASQPGRILLIDDDPALGGYLTKVLTRGGFEVTHELDSASALRRVEAQDWDLLTKAAELIRAGREARAKGREIVLAIGAHPDDVEIGAAARCWPTGRRATPWPS
jgi:DNA-binding response OmpR family regulator